MDSSRFQKGIRSAAQVVGSILLLFTLSACDPVTWYNNDALLVSKVTHVHEVSQNNIRAKVRVFRFAAQTIVELEFLSYPPERLNIAKGDIQVIVAEAPLGILGFVDNFNEASVKKYKVVDLLSTVPMAINKKIAAVFDETKSDTIEVHILGASYKFSASK